MYSGDGIGGEKAEGGIATRGGTIIEAYVARKRNFQIEPRRNIDPAFLTVQDRSESTPVDEFTP